MAMNNGGSVHEASYLNVPEKRLGSLLARREANDSPCLINRNAHLEGKEKFHVWKSWVSV